MRIPTWARAVVSALIPSETTNQAKIPRPARRMRHRLVIGVANGQSRENPSDLAVELMARRSGNARNGQERNQ